LFRKLKGIETEDDDSCIHTNSKYAQTRQERCVIATLQATGGAHSQELYTTSPKQSLWQIDQGPYLSREILHNLSDASDSKRIVINMVTQKTIHRHPKARNKKTHPVPRVGF